MSTDADKARRLANFVAMMVTFNDPDSSEESVLSAIRRIRDPVNWPEMNDEARRVLAAYAFWEEAYTMCHAATTRDRLVEVIRLKVGTGNPHAQSKYNVIQGLMRATIHLMWRKLYLFEATAVAVATASAIPPTFDVWGSRGQALMREILPMGGWASPSPPL